MRVLPPADRVLRDAFAEHRAGIAAGRRPWVDRTECDLRLAVETDGPLLLTGDERVLVGLERQLDPIGAVARILPAAALPRLLVRFVGDPLQRPDSPEEARERLAAVGTLLRVLARHPDLAGPRSLRRLDEAIRIETAALAPRRLPRRARG